MRRHKRSWWIAVAIAGFAVGPMFQPALLGAGDLEPSDPPAPSMKTLDEIPPTWSQTLDGSERFVQVLEGLLGVHYAVLDKETGLVWERSPGTLTMTWYDAFQRCYALEKGGRKGWHLPSVEQLASVVAPDELDPALPEGHPFVGVQSTNYWTSTTSVANTDKAWFVDLTNGNVFNQTKTSENCVWCVRGGPGPDAD